jgi:hypothetical protein
MLIGYARVSTHDQTLALQQDALEQAECIKIYTDTASGAKVERRGLEEVLNYVREGDSLPDMWVMSFHASLVSHDIVRIDRVQGILQNKEIPLKA